MLDGLLLSWLDAEGASLICTLGKAWGEDASRRLAELCRKLIVRSVVPGATAAAVESCGLGVAHLMHAMVKCHPPSLLFTHASLATFHMYAHYTPSTMLEVKAVHRFAMYVHIYWNSHLK